MNRVERVSSLRAVINGARKKGQSIGFVPTMGNLHAGHLELVKIARRHADFIVVSIYINPTQFGADEDLANYPKTPEEDSIALAEMGADLLFLPSDDAMYPGAADEQTLVTVPKIGELYCGQDRPVHFGGVTTVVSRLFNMVQPDVAVFGKKDYQQLAIIRKMVADLAFPVEVVGVETVRDENGLALSSRNGYLTSEEINTAAMLQASLKEISVQLKNAKSVTEKLIANVEKRAEKKLKKAGFEPHYIVVCRQVDLKPARKGDHELVVLAAAVLGAARLIDNLEIDLNCES